MSDEELGDSPDPTPAEFPAAERLEKLEDENQDLRDEVDRLRLERRLLARVVAVFTAGPSLLISLRNWLRALKAGDLLPVDETAKLGAALARRFVRVGFIGLFFASLLPAGLLTWQNFEIRRQNAYFQEQTAELRQQNVQLQDQNEQQVADTRTVRRAQLLSTIYECPQEEAPTYEEGPPPLEPPPCPPIAHPRARQEALFAFVALERSGSSPSGSDAPPTPDLTAANLAGLSLTGASLEQLNLRGADLLEADLSGADLRGADLRGADLTWTDLRRANLTGADFRGANLQGAFLTGAALFGADLSEAKNLAQDEIDSAHGDSNTQLPPDLTRPPSWLDAREEELAPPDAGNLPSP